MAVLNPGSAILIGTKATCVRIEQQLRLLDAPPVILGCVLVDGEDPGVGAGAPSFAIDAGAPADFALPVLGMIDELEAITARRRPGLALLSLAAVRREQIMAIRTRLRRLGVADRFFPTLEDQLAGVGPRTHLDIDLAELLDRPPRAFDEDAVRDVVEQRRVMITGAGGSIGSELARIVARFDPAELVCVDRTENVLFEIDRQIGARHPSLRRQAVLHDVVSARGTRELVGGIAPDVIFHAAAHKHVPLMEDHPLAALENNLLGTKSVADAAGEFGVERFVLISTDKAVNPSSIMGATKRLAEIYVQDQSRRCATSFAIVRFGNVLGSSGSVLDVWARQIAEGGPITVTDPAMTRYFMTIPEAASLVVQAASLIEAGASCGEVFLLDMGEPVRVVEMAERFLRMHGLEPVVRGGSAKPQAAHGASRASWASGGGVNVMPIMFTGARPGEKLHEELAIDAQAMHPTAHPDIHVWDLPAPEARGVAEMLDAVRRMSRRDHPEVVARAIRAMVPEMTAPVAA